MKVGEKIKLCARRLKDAINNYLLLKIKSLIQGEQGRNFVKKGFHGDKFLSKMALDCIDKSDQFIETGTNVGSTSYFVAEHFPDKPIFSCEANTSAYDKALENINKFSNITLKNDKSPDFLYNLNKNLFKKTTCFWLDAHGYGYEWPLREEIKFVTENFRGGFIFIDDFKVPGQPQFKFSKYNGQVCEFDHIKSQITNLEEKIFVYPKYKEKTSHHHPLTGWVLIVFGDAVNDFKIPKVLRGKFFTKND